MASKTILLKGDPLRKEYECGGTITPGHLCKLNTDGEAVVHSDAGKTASKLFAIENALQGDEIGDDYSDGDRGQFVAARQGDEIYAWLADGETAVIESYLESAGDGTLQVYASSSAGAVEYPNSIIGKALEALDLSASAISAAARIKIEVM